MKIGEKATNPGDLRTLVTIQERTMVTDGGGFQVPSWTTVASVWAKWVNLHGAEVWAAQSVNAVGAATVMVRYREDLDTTCQVLKDGVAFEVVSVDDILNRHEFMELKVKLVKAG